MHKMCIYACTYPYVCTHVEYVCTRIYSLALPIESVWQPQHPSNKEPSQHSDLNAALCPKQPERLREIADPRAGSG